MHHYNRLIINILQLFICSFFALLTTENLKAQDSTSHRFTTLKIEVRADFDATFLQDRGGSFTDSTAYGFNGRYFNLCFGGEFGKGFSYYFRQRVIANSGTSSLFDNTDFLYLQYIFKEHLLVRAGKDALAIGGFEYDASPIDVYFRTSFWDNIYCFQLAGSLGYIDKSGRNKLLLQVSNSPYVYYTGNGSEWKQGLLGYSLFWSGNYPHFQALYSVNFFERARGKFVNYLSFGNRFNVGCWSWYIDYQNRAFAADKRFFYNFYLVSRMDVKVKDVNIFVKAGYEQNRLDLANFWLLPDGTVSVNRFLYINRETHNVIMYPQLDPLMAPSQRRVFYGGGIEYRPHQCPSLRLHANINHHFTQPIPSNRLGRNYVLGRNNISEAISVNIGVTWNIDFLRYFAKKLNP